MIKIDDETLSYFGRDVYCISDVFSKLLTDDESEKPCTIRLNNTKRFEILKLKEDLNLHLTYCTRIKNKKEDFEPYSCIIKRSIRSRVTINSLYLIHDAFLQHQETKFVKAIKRIMSAIDREEFFLITDLPGFNPKYGVSYSALMRNFPVWNRLDTDFLEKDFNRLFGFMKSCGITKEDLEGKEIVLNCMINPRFSDFFARLLKHMFDRTSVKIINTFGVWTR